MTLTTTLAGACFLGAVILSGGLVCFGLGFMLTNKWLHWIGAVFLFEEAIETGVMMMALKRKSRGDQT